MEAFKEARRKIPTQNDRIRDPPAGKKKKSG